MQTCSFRVCKCDEKKKIEKAEKVEKVIERIKEVRVVEKVDFPKAEKGAIFKFDGEKWECCIGKEDEKEDKKKEEKDCSNTSLGHQSGHNSIMNTFLGYRSGHKEISSENTYVGHLSGEKSASIGRNTFIGNESGRHSSGAQNTYVGDGTGSSRPSDGSYNTFVGAESGLNIEDGFGNTFVGTISGSSTGSGNWNTFLGQSSGKNNVGGSENTFIGSETGKSLTNGRGCICIGSNADIGNSEASNQIVIGNNVVGTGDNTITFPSNLTSFTSGTEVNFSSPNGGCLYPVSSSRRWKTDIQDVNKTIPTEHIYRLNPVTFSSNYGDSKETDIGLIAEDVNKYIPQLVPKDASGQPASVKYSLLSVLLLAELKKLKERLDTLENTINK